MSDKKEKIPEGASGANAASPAMISITRSFSYKYGLPNYSSADFFCSRNDSCLPGDAERVSGELHAFAKAEVQKSLIEFIQSLAAKEKAEREAERQKVLGRSGKKPKLEGQENAMQATELDAGAVAVDEVPTIQI